MELINSNDQQFQDFRLDVRRIISVVEDCAKPEELKKLQGIIDDFDSKITDFSTREGKLNIGVVGQVKAGKSSFLNTLLFGGQEILPKASTPKTATLTKIEYGESNRLEINYYTPEDWENQVELAQIDDDADEYVAARERIKMTQSAARRDLDLQAHLGHTEQYIFDSYNVLLAKLNDFVAEDGKFTPIVSSVRMVVNDEVFRGLCIVDTPGLNDAVASRTLLTKEYISSCDVVFFLSQSGSFLDKSDWELLSSQLPQEGVKRLVLIASKFDSGIRDVLRERKKSVFEDDDFVDDANIADNIPDACHLVQNKLCKRAQSKVDEFVQDLQRRDASQELINVIRQCAAPVMVSTIAWDMKDKTSEELSREENNIYEGLAKFSHDMSSDLRLLGNFDQVRHIYDSVVADKEQILKEKAQTFVPTEVEKLRELLTQYRNNAGTEVAVLRNHGVNELEGQQRKIESSISGIQSDLAKLFGNLNDKLQRKKIETLEALRQSATDYLSLDDHTGTTTKTEEYTTGHLFWKKVHSYTYDEHYSYHIAADAIENLSRYTLEAASRCEKIFCEVIDVRAVRRQLSNVILRRFEASSDDFDVDVFRMVIEDTISGIQFPEFRMEDTSKDRNAIAANFSGELTSADEKNALANALSSAISNIFDRLQQNLSSSVSAYQEQLSEVRRTIDTELTGNLRKEYKELQTACANKKNQIAQKERYCSILQTELSRL